VPIPSPRSLARLLVGAFVVAAAALRPAPAQATSPFLVVPDPAVAEASPAYRYANMTNEEAFAELDRRQIPYQKVDSTPGVRAPVRLTGRLRGVDFHSSLPVAQRATSMFEILDARLALTLDDFAAVLERHDIDEVVHYTMYRPNYPQQGHGAHAHPQARKVSSGREGQTTLAKPAASAARVHPAAKLAVEVEEPAAEVEKPAAEVEKPAAEVEKPAADGVEKSAGKGARPAERAAPSLDSKGAAEPKQEAQDAPQHGAKEKAEAGAPKAASVVTHPAKTRKKLGSKQARRTTRPADKAAPVAGKPAAPAAALAEPGPAPLANGKGAALPAAKKGAAAPAAKVKDAAAPRAGAKAVPAPPASGKSAAAQPAPARVSAAPPKPRGTWAPPGTRHPAGLAIDVGALRKRDGTWLRVDQHFHGSIGEKTCGDGARVPERPEARELRAIVCESSDLGIFTYVLTPNYNAAHADHYHMEIKPGVRWFLVH